MITEMETKTRAQIEATLGRPIYEDPTNIYITNGAGTYLAGLARLNIECTLLAIKHSVEYCTSELGNIVI